MILASILIADQAHRDQPLPELVAENIDSFRRHHPGLEHRLFRAAEARDVIASDYGAEVLAAYDALKPFSFKCDLARLCILHRHGGLYADLSVYFLARWNLVPHKLGVFRDFLTDAPWQVSNTVIYAPPGHAAIARAIERIVANVRRRYYGPSFLCPTGPVAFGKAITEACEPEDLFCGYSEGRAEVPGYANPATELMHTFVFKDRPIAIKRKPGGGHPGEMGVKGGNSYLRLWAARDIYDGDAR